MKQTNMSKSDQSSIRVAELDVNQQIALGPELLMGANMTVLRETPRSAARARVEGNRTDGGSRPAPMSDLSAW